jgi:hypothetical protein
MVSVDVDKHIFLSMMLMMVNIKLDIMLSLWVESCNSLYKIFFYCSLFFEEGREDFIQTTFNLLKNEVSF